jgi:hypothetical protein
MATTQLQEEIASEGGLAGIGLSDHHDGTFEELGPDPLPIPGNADVRKFHLD